MNCTEKPMFRVALLGVACLATLSLSFGEATARPNLKGNTRPLSTLDEYHRTDMLLKAAIKLQDMGKEKACKTLLDAGKNSEQMYDNQWIHVLCRMLFVKKPAGQFRGRLDGTAAMYSFPGGTRFEDWSLVPIEIVDGVPFFMGMVRPGSGISGPIEDQDEYVAYCMKRCNWQTTKYTMKTREEKQKVLEKLLASPKWKMPLTPYEKTFLSKQIE